LVEFAIERAGPFPDHRLSAAVPDQATHFFQEVTMSVLGDIVSAIFRRSASPASPTTPAGSSSPQAKPATAQAAPPAAQASPIDVAAVMNRLAAQSKEKLDWQKSIVDLMKLLNLDSSLGARKRLAQELHYTGDMNDSASMNVWLHKQVMIKLAENGGRVPNELRS
jgi:hypothetical protein